MSENTADSPRSPHAAHGTDPDRRHLFRLGAGAGLAAGAGLLALGTASPAAATVSGGTYTSVTPQRLIDTRTSGGRINHGQTRTSGVLSGAQYCCVANLTVVDTVGNGSLVLYSAALGSRPSPFLSIYWQGSGKTICNLVMFDTAASGFNIYCSGNGSTHFLLDFIGYFTTSGGKSAEQLAFEERASAAARRLAQR